MKLKIQMRILFKDKINKYAEKRMRNTYLAIRADERQNYGQLNWFLLGSVYCNVPSKYDATVYLVTNSNSENANIIMPNKVLIPPLKTGTNMWFNVIRIR
uniref:Uncharacterized protein n=1 Tax=Romanomermis culicivorax TaxID=13658 RepID=A0A915JH01_ROMCU